MSLQLPNDWGSSLASDLAADYFARLQRYIEIERMEADVFPPERDVFNALDYTPLKSVRVVIIGQDPYHNVGQAHGLCFSVPDGVARPPSLVNIMRELVHDTGVSESGSGCLIPWAKQGVLLINAVLTVRAHEPNSHKNQGWETFTDSIIRAVSLRNTPTVFLLWGAAAHKKIASLQVIGANNTIIRTAHPSPLSAHSGFFGSRPFTRTNEALREYGLPLVDWRL